jgi:hypothetical protein
MKALSILGAAFSVAAFTVPLSGDSYGPFGDFRQVDRAGRYYVVIRKDPAGKLGRGTPVTFEIAERKPGSDPVKCSCEFSPADLSGVANPDVSVRQGDALLGRGKLLLGAPSILVPPILVSASGLGFVNINVTPHWVFDGGLFDAVVIVSQNGTVRHRKRLRDLFTHDEASRFLQTGVGIHWCGSAWIDEEGKSVVVAGSRMSAVDRSPRPIRVVDMETGQVEPLSGPALSRALKRAEQSEVYAALALAAERETPEANPDLKRIFSRDDLPALFRVKAAVALARLGDSRGRDFVKRSAFANAPPESDEALVDVPAVIGDYAAPMLCDFARRCPGRSFQALRGAMRMVSAAAAVPALINLLKKKPGPGVTCLALECLGDTGRDAVPAFGEVVKLLDAEGARTKPSPVQTLAARVLGLMGSGAKRALPELTHLAERHALTEWKAAQLVSPLRG